MHFLAYFLYTALRAKIRVIRFFSKDIVLNLAWNSLKYCVAVHRFSSYTTYPSPKQTLTLLITSPLG